MVRCAPQYAVPTDAKKRIAIIGTGIAGETVAFSLTGGFSPSTHEIAAIYEALPMPGLHAFGVDIKDAPDRTVYVDVPLRACSPHYYPNLTRLYDKIGIERQQVNYSSSEMVYPEKSSYFRYHNILLLGCAIPFFLDRTLTMHKFITAARIIFGLLHFVFASPYRHWRGQLKNLTLNEYVIREGYSDTFVHTFLYPLMSTLLSCTYQQVADYPAEYIAEFYSARSTTIFTGWYRIKSGLREVSNRLLKNVPSQVMRFNNRVQKVVPNRDGHGVTIIDAQGKANTYDLVIIATEASIARKILAEAGPDYDTVLGGVDSFTAEIVVHRDGSLMPASSMLWSGINIFSCEGGSKPSVASPKSPTKGTPFEASMTTAWVNTYNNAFTGNYFETWNPYHAPPKEDLCSKAVMTRAVWNQKGREVFDANITKIQGRDGIWLCGSYASPGVTLLEQAVHSALDVAQDLGVTISWQVRPTYEVAWWAMGVSVIINWWPLVMLLTAGALWSMC